MKKKKRIECNSPTRYILAGIYNALIAGKKRLDCRHFLLDKKYYTLYDFFIACNAGTLQQLGVNFYLKEKREELEFSRKFAKKS